jgi:integrase
MPRPVSALSIKELETKFKTQGRHAVGGATGLYLLVAGEGRSWILRVKVGDLRTDIGLGSYADVSLQTARKKANALREQYKETRAIVSPRAADRAKTEAERITAEKIKTFGECAEVTIANKTADLKNEKHKAQWRSTLETYCKSLWNRPVAEIDKKDIVEVLSPIWIIKHETADRLRGRIEAVMDYAKANDFRAGDNPAEYRGMLEPLLPVYKQQVKPQPSLPASQVGAFMAELRKRDSVSAKAVDFLILTATRTSEVIGAKWSEFHDLDGPSPEWKIPAARMKGKKAHEVPLSDAAVALLKSLPRIVGNDHVFVGSTKTGSLSNMALIQLVRGMNGEPPRYVDPSVKDEGGKPKAIVPHGFRSTFRDWAGEDTTHDREVIEHALAHRLKDKAEASYRRRTSMAKRAKLMQEWADYCGQHGDNVVSIKGVA